MQHIDLFNYQQFSSSNSNFGMHHCADTQYLRDSRGRRLPLKLYAGGPLHSREQAGPFLRPLCPDFVPSPSGDFALMERRFSRAEGFDFLGGPKVRSSGEVALLFRQLEDAAIEHTFLLYTFRDGSYLIQHLSTGGVSAAVVDLRLVAGNVFKLAPQSITLVHNHPSGQLISSPQDRAMQQRLEEIFKGSSVEVLKGIIINLRSGKYLLFGSREGSDQKEPFDNAPKSTEKAPVYRFDRQLFTENYQPERITSPEEAAAYISTQKFGLSDRLELLCLNNASEVMGKFILPQRHTVPRLLELLTTYGGTSAILYGNALTKKQFTFLKEALEVVGFHLLDALQVKSGNFHSLYQNAPIPLKKHLRELYSSKGAAPKDKEKNPAPQALEPARSLPKEARSVVKDTLSDPGACAFSQVSWAYSSPLLLGFSPVDRPDAGA